MAVSASLTTYTFVHHISNKIFFSHWAQIAKSPSSAAISASSDSRNGCKIQQYHYKEGAAAGTTNLVCLVSFLEVNQTRANKEPKQTISVESSIL